MDNFDDRFDDELRQALRREQPGPDFTDRVMNRVAQLPAQHKIQRQERRRWVSHLLNFFKPAQMKWATAAALACLLMVAATGVNRYHEHQRALTEIAEGERAKEQVMLAMRIASEKLNVAQKKVQETSAR